MKKKNRRRLTSMLAMLLAAVLFAMVTIVPVAAQEDATPNEDTTAIEPIEESTDAPEPLGPEARYSIDEGQTWTYADQLFDILWDREAIGADILLIELLRDITLVNGDNWLSFQQTLGRTGKNWIIDGKGHTITRGKGVNMIFCLNANKSKVTMRDITIDGGAIWNGDDVATRVNTGEARGGNAHLIYVGNNSELIFESGVVLQNSDLNDSYYGAAVAVGYSDGPGKLTIKDGVTIRNNRASQGGAIWVYDNGELIMEGGQIYGNYATDNGGGVYNTNSFIMKGGAIYGNAAGSNGGGVFSTGSFNMEYGEIYQNKSGTGGGIVVFSGDATIRDGRITDNEITGIMGGGVLHYNGTLMVTDSPDIQGNRGKGGSVNNVYLNGTTMSISDSLSEGAKIGVTSKTKPTADTPIAVTGANSADFSNSFFSDDAYYRIANTDDNTIQLVAKTILTPVLSLPERVVVHPTSDTAEAIMAEVEKSLQILGVEHLNPDFYYRLIPSYDKTTNTYTVTFRLTENGSETHALGEGSVTEVECKVSVHSFSTDFDKDARNHWHVCTCGAKTDEAAHTFGEWKVTKPASEQETGLRERTCDVCGYSETEIIAQSGTIETDKEQGANTPDVDFSTPKEELINAVLTPEEQELTAGGIDIKILLQIEDIDATVGQDDKQAVIDKATGYEMGQYLDIKLIKMIGANSTNVTQTSEAIKIVLAVPENLKNHDSGTTRSYAVVRVHDGVAEVLKDIDHNEETVTIETDRFSTYALVYQDTVTTDPGTNVPGTGDTSSIGIYGMLGLVSGLFALLLIWEKREQRTAKQ